MEPIGDAALNDLGWASPLARCARKEQLGHCGDGTRALREAGRVVGVAALNLRAVESEEFWRCATVEALVAPTADAGSRRRLLDGAAAAAHEAGLSGVIVYVDSDDTSLVNACRLAGFQHDRTDVRFQLGGPQ